MGRPKAAPDAPALNTIDDCFREITRSNSEIARIQNEHEQWRAKNPEGNWPGAVGLIGYWQQRKDKADTRIADLTSRSR